MKFSFIIPVYKVEDYLATCVDSILNQTYKNFEVLLVDDGSPDNSPKLCDEFAIKDYRIKVIHKKNGGASSARNAGLKIATGDYIIYIDGDDFWLDSNALKRIACKIETCSPEVIIFGGRKYYTIDDRYTGSSYHLNVFEGEKSIPIERLMNHSAFLACAWDKIVKRSVLVNNGIEFTEGQVGEDIEWCCKLLQHDLKYSVLTGDIHVYRQQNASSVTANIKNKNLQDIKLMIEKYSHLALDTNNVPLLNFLALEYLLWILITSHAEGEDGRKMISDMSKYFWLFDYSWYPRVKAIGKIKFLGYNTIRWVLGIAFKLR